MRTHHQAKRDAAAAFRFTFAVIVLMLLFATCTHPARAQSDSVHYVMIPEQQAISFITANLRNSNRVFNQGAITFTTAGLLAYSTDKFAPQEMKAVGYYSSAALGLIGLCLLYHSQSYIARAGRIRLSPAGLVLILTPKEYRNGTKQH